MVPVAATELKTNFKYYMNIVENGEVLAIRRPKKTDNIYVLNEETYKQFLRLQEYAELLEKKPKIKIGMYKDSPFTTDWDAFDAMDKEIENSFYAEES